MKKLFKILIIFVLTFSLCLLTGCGKKTDTDNQSANTVASKLVYQFKKEIKNTKNLKLIATKLSENESIKIAVDVAELDETSYIVGFNNEIKGFEKGYTIRPMISTIPFVVYLFEVDNAESFANNLMENANLRWNICTEADEMISAVVDNYVFFVMSPENFD